MFSDTQLMPMYTKYVTADPARDGIGLELFRLGLYDSVDGSILYSPSSGAVSLNFRICIDLAAPIGLMPKPLRFKGMLSAFAGIVTIGAAAGETDRTPVQYQIKGVQNLM
jgi:hypothetical protein